MMNKMVRLNIEKKKSLLMSVLVVSLILVSLLFSGCSSGDEIVGNVVELNYNSKYAGPSIVDVEIGPRSTIDENSKFYLFIDLENQGSQELRQGSVKVYGYDRWYMEIGDSDPSEFQIDAYNEESPIVLNQIIEFEGFANILPDEKESYSGILFVEADFRYSTQLQQDVCINPSQYDIYGGCENPKEEVIADAQYSPIVISSFEQDVFEMGSTVYFTFHIENKGKGEVEKLYLKDASLSAEDLIECEFKGEGNEERDDILSYIFDEDDKGKVDLECKYSYSGLNSAVTKALYLELSYDYKLTETVDFKVES